MTAVSGNENPVQQVPCQPPATSLVIFETKKGIDAVLTQLTTREEFEGEWRNSGKGALRVFRFVPISQFIDDDNREIVASFEKLCATPEGRSLIMWLLRHALEVGSRHRAPKQFRV